MNSYRQILYHIVFCTYNRKNTLPHAFHGELYKYIWGIIQKRKGFLYKIGGTENHIHILSDLHPTVCLSDYIKEIKTGSNQWMKKTGNFPLFESQPKDHARSRIVSMKKMYWLIILKIKRSIIKQSLLKMSFVSYSQKMGLSGMKDIFFKDGDIDG